MAAWWDRRHASAFLARARHPGRDVALAGATFTGGLVLIGLGTQPVGTGGDAGWAWFLLPVSVINVAVGLRRTAPMTSLAVGTTALVGDLLLGGSLATALIFTQVLYCVGKCGPRWPGATGSSPRR